MEWIEGITGGELAVRRARIIQRTQSGKPSTQPANLWGIIQRFWRSTIDFDGYNVFTNSSSWYISSWFSFFSPALFLSIINILIILQKKKISLQLLLTKPHISVLSSFRTKSFGITTLKLIHFIDMSEPLSRRVLIFIYVLRWNSEFHSMKRWNFLIKTYFWLLFAKMFIANFECSYIYICSIETNRNCCVSFLISAFGDSPSSPSNHKTRWKMI